MSETDGRANAIQQTRSKHIMAEFFRGWKRKIGVLTLVMACAFMAGWVRSNLKRDFIEVDLSNVTYRIGSTESNFRLIRVTPAAGTGFSWSASPIPAPPAVLWANHYEMEWRRDWAGFQLGTGVLNGTDANKLRVTVYSFPYWSIVLPLTALSAWLLLSKPSQMPEPSPLDDNREI